MNIIQIIYQPEKEMKSMQNSTTSANPDMFPGLDLLEEEQVLYSGYGSGRLRNPLQPERIQSDCFFLTNRRLIMHTSLRRFFGGKTAFREPSAFGA